MHARDHILAELGAELAARREAALYRALRRVDSAQGAELSIEGRTYVQFCTNNYLGLADDPALKAAAREATEKYGTGAGASRLVAGSMALHHELEAALAAFKGTEAALLLPTGFMANLAVLTTLAGEADAVVSDKLNHASLLDAAKFSGANHRTFVHRDYERAGALLAKHETQNSKLKTQNGAGRKFLVTDSVFSMDGDVADLGAACEVADAAGALVIVDEAHGTGVLGETGAGLAELQGVSERIFVSIGTLSKAFGSVGGFVAGPRAVIEMLINAARSFIYTTALPPACAAASLAALKIIKDEPQRRARVLALAEHVRKELRGMGFDTGDSATPIVPVMMGGADKAVAAAEFLKERGLYVPAIRPPTVPPNTARLRISFMATHSDGQIERLLEAMKALREKA